MTGPHCKYTPTCSEYAIQALKKYGAVKGMILAGYFGVIRGAGAVMIQFRKG